MKVQKNDASPRLPWEAPASAVPPRRTRRLKGLTLRSRPTMSAAGGKTVTAEETNGDAVQPFALWLRVPIR